MVGGEGGFQVKEKEKKKKRERGKMSSNG